MHYESIKKCKSVTKKLNVQYFLFTNKLEKELYIGLFHLLINYVVIYLINECL